MSQEASRALRRPRTDDQLMRDIVFGISGYPAVLVAHDLKLYELLAQQPRTIPGVCQALGLKTRPAEALVAVSAALGLLKETDGCYSLSEVGEDYLLASSPTYFGGYFDMMIRNYSMYAFDSVKAAVLTDTPQLYGGEEAFQSHQERSDRVRTYTRAMHGTSMAAALAWPEHVNLDGRRQMLDVAGGSGAHAIGAAQRWPHLDVVILELASVCTLADELISERGLEERVRTHAGDMWSDPFPAADVHFYSQIYHDWPPERCQMLTRKSYESLDPGGLLVIHEMLFDDRKTGPFSTAAMNLNMLLQYGAARQYSGLELSSMLQDAGFTDIRIIPTFGYYSIVVGQR